jgi:hypothetical protein
MVDDPKDEFDYEEELEEEYEDLQLSHVLHTADDLAEFDDEEL